ncbi:hypothetical protein ANCDUO_10286 [Ancylostoma duodenale]|uniref:Uncharacterized protein n=1 Tax=Ancylostoma duodenale TaxID=51022 RepID=A0A0C2GE69_9BILA|nr:hypothetical protein ANCDUO_10286 [Ancylostoma duodenale]
MDEDNISSDNPDMNCGRDVGLEWRLSLVATAPTTMQVEFFNAAGAVVRTVTGAPPSLVVNVYCVNGAWHVRTSPTATTTVPISTVSCAQTGSTGADRALIPGTAVN